MNSNGCVFLVLIIIIIALIIYICQYQSNFDGVHNPKLKDGEDTTPIVLEQYHNANPNKSIIVYYYAPWCGYCNKMSPIYDTFAANGRKYGFKAVKINADKNKPDPKHNVKGFPTVIGLKGNLIRFHKAERTNESLTMFAKSL